MPQWIENAIFYEIYPQSFMDTNSDGIGDFKGIISKLGYIKDLGCNAIWMNPCFISPFMDAGYDISDYYTVAPRYGTNDDLKEIFDKAHALGMHVLIDLVPGHTSVEHPWFKQSMKAETNEYSGRYVWTDNIWESPQNMNCIRGFSERNGACAVNFFSHQPALNYGFYECNRTWQMPMDADAPQATLAELKNIMRFWLTLGCDGFRVDMAGSLVKNDTESKGTISLWQNIRNFLDEDFPDAAIISEWGEPDKSLMGGFHMDFLLHFGPSHYNDLFRCDEPYFSSRGKGNASKFIEKYIENYKKTEGRGLICIPSGNHDMDRMARRLSQEEMKIAFAFLLTMPGAPFIYYGDEIGMRYIENLPSVEGGYERTGSRSPMQWNSLPNAGFSMASSDKLYIPIDNDVNRPTVEAQMSDSDSLYHELRRLISVRKEHKALSNCGKIEFVYVKEKEYPLCYLRTADEEKILVIINPSAKEHSFSCKYTPDTPIYSIGGNVHYSEGLINVPPCFAGFYRL